MYYKSSTRHPNSTLIKIQHNKINSITKSITSNKLQKKLHRMVKKMSRYYKQAKYDQEHK